MIIVEVQRDQDEHSTRSPLHLLHDIQTAVYDELVHVSSFVTEARDAIASLFRGAELILEDWVVFRANDGKIVGHCPCQWRVLLLVLIWLSVPPDLKLSDSDIK